MGCFHASPLTRLFRTAWRLYPWYLTMPHAQWAPSAFLQGMNACSDSVASSVSHARVPFSSPGWKSSMCCGAFSKCTRPGPSQEIPTHWAWLPRHSYLRGSDLERPFPVSTTGLFIRQSPFTAVSPPLPSPVVRGHTTPSASAARKGWAEGQSDLNQAKLVRFFPWESDGVVEGARGRRQWVLTLRRFFALGAGSCVWSLVSRGGQPSGRRGEQTYRGKQGR